MCAKIIWFIKTNCFYFSRWVFGNLICTITGFIMYFIGCTSIYLLTVISFERWFVIMNPFKQRLFDKKISIFTVIFCCLFSLIWCIAPLLGWSHYSLELSKTTCSVEWNDKSFNVVSYNFVIFGFVYFIPLVLLFITNIKLIIVVNN